MVSLLIIANEESLKGIGLDEMVPDSSRSYSSRSIFTKARQSAVNYGKMFARTNNYELVVVADSKESWAGRKYEARLDFYNFPRD